ncbi:MAG TPA: DUF3667 domain-containing protein, partial [Phnomibacter sp.]|nr:DUF3667 domain-containing protein [Phnomibacter sp.]
GTLIREYIAGKRKKYMSPVTLLLICAGLSYLSINAFDLGEVNMRNMPAPETLEFSSEASKERYIQRYDRAYQFNMFINKNSKLVTLSATPLLALLYWLLFLKARFNYFEHLVACMFSNSATSLVYALILMPIVSLMGGGMIYLVVTFLFLVGETIYRAWCYYGMMGYHGWKKAIKVFFYSLVVTGVWSLFSAGMGFLFISGFFS